MEYTDKIDILYGVLKEFVRESDSLIISMADYGDGKIDKDKVYEVKDRYMRALWNARMEAE